MAAAATKERGYREYREPSKHTRLKWTFKSTSSNRRRRRFYSRGSTKLNYKFIEEPSRLIYDPEILRLYQECRDCAFRQGLSQPTSSNYPFKLATSKELRLRQLVSGEEL